jgi:hypothetical protein
VRTAGGLILGAPMAMYFTLFVTGLLIVTPIGLQAIFNAAKTHQMSIHHDKK